MPLGPRETGSPCPVFLCASQNPECSLQCVLAIKELVLRHRKQCLIPAHRETPKQSAGRNSITDERIVSPVFSRNLRGKTRHSLNRMYSVPFHSLWLCAWLTGLHQERAMTCAFNLGPREQCIRWLLHPDGISQGKNTGVSSHFFLFSGSPQPKDQLALNSRRILYHPSHQGELI